MKYEAIVIGVSAGGLVALSCLLEALPAGYPLPIAVAQHRAPEQSHVLEEVLQAKCNVRIKEADEKEQLQPGTVYLAPPGYHLLVERDHSLSLNCDPPVHFSRPSIDVLFETAADAYGPSLLGIILTGANKDGAAGIEAIRRHGGTTIAQNPGTAQFPAMPRAAIATGSVQRVMDLRNIRDFLSNLRQSDSK